MFLATALGTITKVQKLYDDVYTQTSSADLFFGFDKQKFDEDYVEFFENRQEVATVKKEANLFGSITVQNDKNIASIISKYDQEAHDFSLDVGEQHAGNQFKLKKNEAMLPSYFRDEYDLKKGDLFQYKSGDLVYKFKVVGFFEDPLFGSPFYEVKRILVSNSYFKMMDANVNENNLKKFILLDVQLKEKYRDADLSKHATKLIDDFGQGSLSLFGLDKGFMTTVRLMVPTIVSSIIICFSIFLLVILVIVLRYTILATIETDYRSLGIMKAIGFKSKDLKQMLVLQYSLLTVAGALFGLIGAYIATPFVGAMLLNTSGIWWKEDVSWYIYSSVFATLLLFVGMLVYSQASQVGRIKPIEAIVYGKERSNKKLSKFANRHYLVERLPMIFRFSLKQLFTQLRQYTSLFALSIMFTFMLVTISGLNSTFKTDVAVSNLLGFPLYDVRFEVNNKQLMSRDKVEAILNEVESEYDTTFKTSEQQLNIQINDVTVLLNVNSKFEEENVVEGRIPKKAEEILITDGVSKLINKTVGDQVTLSLSKNNDKQAKYTIVGINNKVAELGKNISILDSGYQKLEPNFEADKYMVKLKSIDHLEKDVKELKAKYGYKGSGLTVADARKDVQGTVDTIQMALSSASLAIALTTVLLIVLITTLISIVILSREMIELGIMKAVGFTSYQSRIQFTFRFFTVALTSSLVGLLISSLFSQKLIDVLFSTAGISKITFDNSFSLYGISILFVVGATTCCAWMISRRIKRVDFPRSE